MSRTAEIHRKTKETEIAVTLNLDGEGEADVSTGIPFLDHMLDLLGKHSSMNLKVRGAGDLAVDFHHTVEDTGITIGQALTKALGNKAGIRRYGFAYLPMDETLARVVVDLSGRPYVEYRAPAQAAPIGAFAFQLVEEFMRGFAVHAGMNLHIEILYGRDSHHMAEAIFKGLGRALREACEIDPRVKGIPSTKGVL
jgi:imidazoleglycerol-phosphate dehydratase